MNLINSNTFPAVSVVIPTFNREQLLPIAVSSVLNQSYDNWELIIVDDGSTDGTVNMLNEYTSKDRRIRWVKNAGKKGPAGARNTGINEAQGKYVALLDSDDEWTSDHLEQTVSILEEQQAIDIIACNAIRKNWHTKEVYQERALDVSRLGGQQKGRLSILDHDTTYPFMVMGALFPIQTMVGKKECFVKTQFREELWICEDHIWQFDLTQARYQFAFLDEVHLTYWAHDDNSTVCNATPDPEKTISVYTKLIQSSKVLLSDSSMPHKLRRKVLRAYSRDLFWQLGYNGYQQAGNFSTARKCYIQSLSIQPWFFLRWKTMALSYVAEVILILRNYKRNL